MSSNLGLKVTSLTVGSSKALLSMPTIELTAGADERGCNNRKILKVFIFCQKIVKKSPIDQCISYKPTYGKLTNEL